MEDFNNKKLTLFSSLFIRYEDVYGRQGTTCVGGIYSGVVPSGETNS
jgi:hypothetical protein